MIYLFLADVVHTGVCTIVYRNVQCTQEQVIFTQLYYNDSQKIHLYNLNLAKLIIAYQGLKLMKRILYLSRGNCTV